MKQNLNTELRVRRQKQIFFENFSNVTNFYVIPTPQNIFKLTPLERKVCCYFIFFVT